MMGNKLGKMLLDVGKTCIFAADEQTNQNYDSMGNRLPDARNKQLGKNISRE